MNVAGAFPAPIYSAAAAFLPAATVTGDIFTIKGAANYLVRVLYMSVIVSNSAGITVSWQPNKRSTLDTGGTSAVVTSVPHDSADPAAQAVVNSYTAMPTAGTLVGPVRSRFTTTNAAGGLVTLAEWLFHPYPIVLRAAAEQLCLTLGSALAGPNARCEVVWSEESIV